MGRGRAPCCAKVGLNKGSLTPEEDMRLIAYIHKYGHGNWRALPKLAGLLRCGKSCRLRWNNYLRPNIKRRNFSKEEEDVIIKLHGLLGNKWSKIAACLPGRTDNEIKNVWNTHIKKKLSPKNKSKPSKSNDQPSSPSSVVSSASISCSNEEQTQTNELVNNINGVEKFIFCRFIFPSFVAASEFFLKGTLQQERGHEMNMMLQHKNKLISEMVFVVHVKHMKKLNIVAMSKFFS